MLGTFNVSNGSITAVISSVVYSVDKSHPNYSLLLEYYKGGKDQDFIDMYSFRKTKEEVLVQNYVKETGIVLKDSKVFYNDKEVHHSYGKRILEAQQNGFPIEPMVKFFENLLSNPSATSVNEAPDFLMNRNLPLTDDGCFLAYKSIKSDWYSKSSGTLTLLSGKANAEGYIYNGVGEVIECVRNEVDDERSKTCSKGLHVGGLKYSGPGGNFNDHNDIVVIVKVNPRDIVSVPRDHNAQKVRVCKYEVVSVYKEPLNNSCEGVEKTEVKSKFLKPYEVRLMDTITFLYKGKNDLDFQERFFVVSEVLPDHFYGILLPSDPSYKYGNEFRQFMFSNMKDIQNYEFDISEE